MKTKCKHVKILMTRKLIKSNELNKPGTGKKPKDNRGKGNPPTRDSPHRVNKGRWGLLWGGAVEFI